MLNIKCNMKNKTRKGFYKWQWNLLVALAEFINPSVLSKHNDGYGFRLIYVNSLFRILHYIILGNRCNTRKEAIEFENML
jgi:hypothetical protein